MNSKAKIDSLLRQGLIKEYPNRYENHQEERSRGHQA